jgi:UDP-N-acetylmuramoyl-tripeptide--D-alanyl-D-alanine ligase
MNHAGEIRALVRIAEPDVRVWTNVGDAHLGYFGSRAAVAAAKAEVLDGAGPDTLVVSNADDALVAEHTARVAARHVTFGRRADATVRLIAFDDRGFDGTTADVETPRGLLHLEVPLAGQAQLMNVLAAVSVALEFGIQPSAIVDTVATIQPVARRGAVSRLSNGARLVDDSYNASPEAVRAMLAAMSATPTSGRRIAVLGEMLELGAASHALHDACGRAAVAAGVQELVVIGGAPADGLVEGAVAAGLGRAHVHRFADSASAATLVPSLVSAGDLLLVKASRGTRADVVVDRLLERG